jgi:hypothetical protein
MARSANSSFLPVRKGQELTPFQKVESVIGSGKEGFFMNQSNSRNNYKFLTSIRQEVNGLFFKKKSF